MHIWVWKIRVDTNKVVIYKSAKTSHTYSHLELHSEIPKEAPAKHDQTQEAGQCCYLGINLQKLTHLVLTQQQYHRKKAELAQEG